MPANTPSRTHHLVLNAGGHVTGREIGVSGLTKDFSGACREGVSKGVRVVCAKNAHQSVARRALACFIGGHSGVPVVFLFLRARINRR